MEVYEDVGCDVDGVAVAHGVDTAALEGEGVVMAGYYGTGFVAYGKADGRANVGFEGPVATTFMYDQADDTGLDGLFPDADAKLGGEREI